MVINRYGPCLPACVCYRQTTSGGRSDNVGRRQRCRRFEVGAAGGAQFKPAGPMWTNPPHRSLNLNLNPPTSQLLKSAAYSLKLKVFVFWFCDMLLDFGIGTRPICIDPSVLPSTSHLLKSAAKSLKTEVILCDLTGLLIWTWTAGYGQLVLKWYGGNPFHWQFTMGPCGWYWPWSWRLGVNFSLLWLESTILANLYYLQHKCIRLCGVVDIWDKHGLPQLW